MQQSLDYKCVQDHACMFEMGGGGPFFFSVVLEKKNITISYF